MEAQDTIQLPSCGDSENGNEEADKLGIEDGEVGNSDEEVMEEIEEGQLISKKTEISGEYDLIEITETNLISKSKKNDDDDSLQVEEDQLVSDMVSDQNAAVLTENVAELERKDVGMPPVNGDTIEGENRDVGSLSGVKRKRMTCDEQPSVVVKFYSLSRESKQKLEELLREWSEWHVKNSTGTVDHTGGSETGEGTYFPALDIGTEKHSAVSYWMESDIRKPEDDDFMPVEDASVPLYDRGFALGADGSANLEGGSELLDVPRCFNCGSYSHSLKECPKPRDNMAVNNSRKQLKIKRNQTAGSRNSTRYYQDSRGGKYEGLRPGLLDTKTRQLLGLGELDPPPWLNRMREIGYPPGYLELDDENLPSGITIYADEDVKDDKAEGEEEGEILEPDHAKALPKKMSVNFPGINAPIPENADERVWAIRSSNSARQRNGDSYHSESYSRGRRRDNNYRDLNDDDPFERASRYTSRYGDYDYNSPSHSSRRNAPASRSPSSGRPFDDQGRNDQVDSEVSVASHLYSSYSYNSSRRFSDHNSDLDGSRGDQLDHSSRGRDRDDRYRNRSER